MSRILNKLSAAFVLGLLPGISLAEPVYWGQFDLEVGAGKIASQEGNATFIDETSPTAARAYGKLGVDFGQFGLQVDLSRSAQKIDPDEYTGFLVGGYAALHVKYDFGAGQAGLFGGKGKTTPASDGTADFEFAGLEGSYNFGSVLMTASAGKFDATDDDDTDAFHDGRFARMGALYVLGNGGVMEGGLAYFKGKQDTGASYDMNAFVWDVKYSQAIGSSSFAWSAGLQGGRYSNGNGGDNGKYTETRAMVGFTTWFGGGSFDEAKRRGAFDVVDFARVVNAGNNVD